MRPISVIIPTINEEAQISATISHLLNANDAENILEIIVSDGGSSDRTREAVLRSGAIFVSSPKKGRAAQMNFGAGMANGQVLYFLHADSLPEPGFTNKIASAIKAGYSCGCMRLKFDYSHWFLRANAWFTRFNVNAFRFGDQGLFVLNKHFVEAGGFDTSHIILEDQEIIARLKKLGSFKVLESYVITSSRKYLQNGIYRTQAVFFFIYFKYRMGTSQERLVQLYRRLIRQDKL